MNPAIFVRMPWASLTPDAVAQCGADAVIVDISTAGNEDDRGRARAMLPGLLRDFHTLPRPPLLYVKIGGFAGGQAEGDLAAAMAGDPDGIFLSGCQRGADVQHLDVLMAVHEAEHGRTAAPARIIAEFGATARGLLSGSSYENRSRRLTALSWDDAALAESLGLPDGIDVHAHPTAQHGRTMTVLRAREAGVRALTCLPAPGDRDAGRRASETGFSGVILSEASAVSSLRPIFKA